MRCGIIADFILSHSIQKSIALYHRIHIKYLVFSLHCNYNIINCIVLNVQKINKNTINKFVNRELQN